MSTAYSVGQMNQLGDALEAAGFTAEEVTKLRSFPGLLANIKKVLAGTSKIVAVTHVIDCDANPYVPQGWTVEEHKKGGMFEWNLDKVRLHLSPNQKDGKVIQGHKLREELVNEPALKANVLDYLLAHQELIPEEWKGKYIFFWGTVYRDSDGCLCVRYLCWGGGRWVWGCRWLGAGFGDDNPALLCASI